MDYKSPQVIVWHVAHQIVGGNKFFLVKSDPDLVSLQQASLNYLIAKTLNST